MTYYIYKGRTKFIQTKKILKKMKLETKDYVIISLILFCIWIYFNPFNNDEISSLEKDNKNKQELIDKIELKRDSILSERVAINIEIKRLEKLSVVRLDSINIYKKLSNKKDNEIEELKEDLKSFSYILSRREKKIDELIKNPIVLPIDKLVEKTREKIK